MRGRPRIHSDEKVAEVRRLLAQGLRQREIALLTGVSKSAVGRIALGL